MLLLLLLLLLMQEVFVAQFATQKGKSKVISDIGSGLKMLVNAGLKRSKVICQQKIGCEKRVPLSNLKVIGINELAIAFVWLMSIII